MSLPAGPLVQHLASLHAIIVHLDPSEDALRLAEHHLREIGVFTAEQPGDQPGRVRLPQPLGWKDPAYPVTGTYAEKIQPFIEEQRKNNEAAIEQMCERMLTQEGTDYGVLVTEMNNGTVTAELSPDVPFSQIHHKREADR